MTSHKYLAVTFTIILGIFAINTNARSWDIAIVVGREVEFFAQNKTLTGQSKLADAVSLQGVAYDDVTRTMYFADPTNENMSIYSNDLTDKNFTSKPLFKKQKKSGVLGLAFDTKTRTLFWSDTVQEVIMKMHVPLVGPPDEPSILHNLTRRNPRGIALDLCNSHIYWVNSNISNASIERSNLDGSDRMIVINESSYMPLAVAVDHAMEKLYWIDDVQGFPIKLERSNLDGSGREMFLEFEYHHPVHLAVDHESVYWTDLVQHAVWRTPKDGKHGPVRFRSYNINKYDTNPGGIVARDNVGKIDCAAMGRIRQKTSLQNPTLSQPVESYNNLTTSTEESELTTETSKYCLNGGHVLEKEDNCQCEPGFAGPNCETNLCHNYCFQGSCAINSKGEPTCKCNETFVGPRCETDLCKDYCLHDGQCSVQNERPICKCIYSKGSRCEILSNTTELCRIFCTNAEPVPISVAFANCRCTPEEEEERTAQIVTFRENDEYRTLLPIFSAFVGVLVLVIFVLSYYVNKFRRRPRIKKRFVVSKSGVMPLTSRPQVPDSQCEITIENCCNMNICETPCFEPKLRTATPAPNGTKKEEKNSLLDNMEGNSW